MFWWWFWLVVAEQQNWSVKLIAGASQPFCRLTFLPGALLPILIYPTAPILNNSIHQLFPPAQFGDVCSSKGRSAYKTLQRITCQANFERLRETPLKFIPRPFGHCPFLAPLLRCSCSWWSQGYIPSIHPSQAIPEIALSVQWSRTNQSVAVCGNLW